MAKPNAANYRALGAQIARQVGVPWNVFDALVNQESGWNPNAISPAGAIGFGQLMPGTAQGLGVDPHDPVQNLRGAAIYLKHQIDTFGGNIPKALAAYNAGPGAVQRYGGIPPYAETQNYVRSILASAKGGAKDATPLGAAWGPDEGPKLPPTPPPAPDGLAGMVPTPAGGLGALMNFAKPSDSSVGMLQPLGGLAAKTAKAAQSPIPVPSIDLPKAPGGNADPGAEINFPPVIPLAGGLRGQVKMVQGGNIRQQYPNLVAQSQVDWRHVNPRLLQILQKEAEKRGVIISLISGYRSSAYNQQVGGAQDSRHQAGLAVDAFINGHPIGEVITPEEWAKLGIRSGNAPGFYKGKPDPEHLDMAGIPLKQKGPKA